VIVGAGRWLLLGSELLRAIDLSQLDHVMLQIGPAAQHHDAIIGIVGFGLRKPQAP